MISYGQISTLKSASFVIGSYNVCCLDHFNKVSFAVQMQEKKSISFNARVLELVESIDEPLKSCCGKYGFFGKVFVAAKISENKLIDRFRCRDFISYYTTLNDVLKYLNTCVDNICTYKSCKTSRYKCISRRNTLF